MIGSILVVYFSHSGNTKKLAEMIHDRLGGDIHEITPVKPYPREYSVVTDQAKREMREVLLPELSAGELSVESYSLICIGSPNWWSTIAPPVATFLSAHDFSGKTICPFCTHGGGGVGRIERDIAARCPEARIMSCMGVYVGGSGRINGEIADWLDRVEHSSKGP